ncbi:MAG: hypothetical protein JWP42_2413 [Pseudomonas sp.]|nr:hypothetical protein [Pseudomonas sp.]
MVARLVVTKSTGEQLFDTSLIAYGLVKSGNMAYIESWTRRTIKSAQLDPNNGGNWNESTVTTDGNFTPMFGFSVANCQSPIAFIVGTGCLNGTYRTGNTMTFLYSNADANTKFYCFDLMANNFSGSPYLKTFKSDGTTTFNSLQYPLNVIGTVQAPAAPVTPGMPYVGGYSVRRSTVGTFPSLYDALDGRVDIALTGGVEYAVFLPFTRSCGINDRQANFGGGLIYGGVEGAYGRVGGISFMFGASGATTSTPMSGTAGTTFDTIPTVYPTALIIATAGLPFPFN